MAAAVVMVSAFFTNSAFASILGSTLVDTSSIKMAPDTYMTTNQFYSDQKGVGKQTENYFEYTPNSGAVPFVTNGDRIFGKRNIQQVNQYMVENGIQPMVGINADYFSFQTGVPMSHTIMDGEIVTKDVEGQDAIGFRKDGTAVIGWLQITTAMQVEGGDTIYIDNINKYRQPYAIYMMTDQFADTTKTSSPGLDVILNPTGGNLKLGDSMTATVESITHSEGEITIPAGKIVLSIDDKGFQDLYAQLSQLQVGQQVTISNTVDNIDLWGDVDSAIGCIGGRIVQNGEISKKLEAGSAPRTAVGIKPDGNVIFYTIDGRQTGHSYGVRLETLAKRMIELGCTEVVNLDGGGSTSLAGVYPGMDEFTVINSPSEGSLRNVSNFIFLKNNAQRTGILNELYLYPYNGHYLSGTSQKMDARGVDTGFYPVDVNPSDVEYQIDSGEITADGVATFSGAGAATVTAKKGDITGSVKVNVTDTITDVKLTRQDNGNAVSDFRLYVGESFDMKAESVNGYNSLISTDNCYNWAVEDEAVGQIDTNGVFTAKHSGKTKVSVWLGNGVASVTAEVIADADHPDPQEPIEPTPTPSVSPTPTQTPSPTQSPVEEPDLSNEGYPKIDLMLDGTTVQANITGNEVPDESISIKVDGVVRELDLITHEDGATIVTYQAEKDFPDFKRDTHKLSVTATDQEGNTSIGYLTIRADEPMKAPFTDTKGHWAEDTIDYLYQNDVIHGESVDGKELFYPQKSMTRAEFAVMMSNALKVDLQQYETTNLEFADAQKIPSWAVSQVKAVYAMGIITGKQDGDKIVFDPSANITRAEAMTMLGRILPEQVAQKKLDFTDLASVPEWSKQSMRVLYHAGAINGYEDGSIRPLAEVTKAEAVKLLFYIY